MAHPIRPMKKYYRSILLKLSLVLVGLASACGGGGGDSTDSALAVANRPISQPNNTAPKLLASVTVQSTNSVTQSSVPITFGQPFKMGDLPAGISLASRDNLGNRVPLQLDEISTHSDGSVRFAVISAQLINLQPNEKRVIDLKREPGTVAARAQPISVSNFDPKLVATVYSPQVSMITFGNRVGATAGTPYLEGEQITLQLGNAPAEKFVLTVTAALAGGGYPTLTKIAEGFMALINANSKTYRAYKLGEGGGYENLWISSSQAGSPAFDIKFVYAGTAVQTINQLQSYRAPRTYQASPRQALDAMIAAGKSPRLSGAVASEYTVVAPFIEVSSGVKHPQLTARLYTRFYDGGQRVRTDMVLENNWTYEPDPGNLTYDLSVTQGGQTLLHQPAFTHNHHARWHKVLWTGAEPQAIVRHDMRYFLDTKATWNYDLSVQIPESVLAEEAASLAKADTSPMGPAMVTPYFPGTGGRPDIDPLPRWTALYLLSQDPRQHAVMLANADAAASVPIHYRDAATGQPVSLVTHPGLALRFGSSSAADAMPVMTNGATIWSPDTNHQASFAYIPYLVTGDTFYLDEILFWANWNMGSKNPFYRDYGKGLLNGEEVRGQAWGLRSPGEAVRALPDNHSMKAYFTTKLADNLAWYNGVYPPRNPDDATLSQIGMVERGGQLNDTRPWMNDYMAIVLGQLAENDDSAALSYLQWLSHFTVGRFTHESQGYCIAYAPVYTLKLFDATGKQITDWGALFQRNWPTVTNCGNLLPAAEGYPELATGYAASGRTMLAISGGLNIPGAATAHVNWLGKTPKIDSAFSYDPTWAVVPR